MELRELIDKALSSKVLILVLGIQSALIAFRALNLHFTGFMTPDEANYVFDIIAGHPYGTRYFFTDQLSFLLWLFSVNSFGRFEVFFPFYLAAWSFAFLILTDKTLGLVTQDRKTRAFVMITLPFAISYSLLSVGILTEQPGLTTCMLGIYAWIRYVKIQRKWYLAALSSAAFVAAAYTREPYLIFPAASACAWALLGITRKVPIKHATLFVIIALIVSVPSNTLTPTPPSVGTNSVVSGVVNSAPAITTITRTIGTTTTAISISTRTTISNFTTVTLTTSYTVTVNTTAVVTEVAPSPLLSRGFFSGWARVIANSLTLFFVGLVIGWGPTLLVVSLISFIYLLRLRQRTPISLLTLFVVIISLGTFFGAVFVFHDEFGFYLTQGLSNLIRLTNTAIPAYVLLSPILYERLSERRIKILAVVLVALTAGSAGLYLTAVQSNFTLPYNVLDFGHAYAPLAARNYLLQNASVANPAVVFPTLGWGTANFFLMDIPGISVYPQTNVFASAEVSQFLDSNYAEKFFIQLHPSTFYILSVSNLVVWNSSLRLERNVNVLQSSGATFLVKSYGLLYHIDASYLSAPYTIESVQLVFNSPTGLLLKVHAAWPAA